MDGHQQRRRGTNQIGYQISPSSENREDGVGAVDGESIQNVVVRQWDMRAAPNNAASEWRIPRVYAIGDDGVPDRSMGQ